MTYMKSTNDKNCTFCEKIDTEFFIRTHFFTEIFQNQVLKVQICHFLKPCHRSILKDTEVSFEHIHYQV